MAVRTFLRLAFVCLAAAGALGADCYRRPMARPSPLAAGDQVVRAAEPPPVCGDGIVSTGEACDDGNTAPGDGCFACALEPAQCGPGTDGVVWQWRCDGSPSRCTLATCTSTGPNADCAPELATRKLTATIRLEGFISGDDASRVRGPGLDCTCRDTLEGRVCDPGCTATVPTCAATTLEVTSTTADPQRWAWGCSGTAAQCRVKLDADARVEAQLAAAPIHVAGAASFASYSVQVLAADGPGDSVLAQLTVSWGVRIGRVETHGDSSNHAVLAVVSPRGEVVGIAELGTLDRVRAHRAVFADGGYWVVLSEGDQRGDTRKLDDDPRYSLVHFTLDGKRDRTTALGRLEEPVIAATAGGGVAVVATVLRAARNSEGDRYWSPDRLVAWRFDDQGRQSGRDELRLDGGTMRTSAIRMLANNDIAVAGVYASDHALPGSFAVPSLPATDHHLRGFAMEIGGGVRGATWEADRQRGITLAANGDAITVDDGAPQSLTRHGLDGKLVWTHQIGGGLPSPGYLLDVAGNGEQFAFTMREVDETMDASRGHFVVRVVDGEGTYLHAWSLPSRAPASLGLSVAALAHDGRAVLAGTVTGPLAIGRIRYRSGTGAVLWLDPRARPPVGR